MIRIIRSYGGSLGLHDPDDKILGSSLGCHGLDHKPPRNSLWLYDLVIGACLKYIKGIDFSMFVWSDLLLFNLLSSDAYPPFRMRCRTTIDLLSHDSHFDMIAVAVRHDSSIILGGHPNYYDYQNISKNNYVFLHILHDAHHERSRVSPTPTLK